LQLKAAGEAGEADEAGKARVVCSGEEVGREEGAVAAYVEVKGRSEVWLRGGVVYE